MTSRSQGLLPVRTAVRILIYNSDACRYYRYLPVLQVPECTSTEVPKQLKVLEALNLELTRSGLP